MRYIAKTKLKQMSFEELQEAGFLDHVKVRNNSIREQHAENLAKGMITRDSIEKLSEEFFISEDSIISIIYTKHRK